MMTNIYAYSNPKIKSPPYGEYGGQKGWQTRQGVRQPRQAATYRWGVWMSSEKSKFLSIPFIAFKDKQITAGQQIFLGLTLGLMNNDEKCCYATNQYLADECGIQPSVASRWIGKLAELGYLQIKRDGKRRQIFAGRKFEEDVDKPVDNLSISGPGQEQLLPNGQRTFTKWSKGVDHMVNELLPNGQSYINIIDNRIDNLIDKKINNISGTLADANLPAETPSVDNPPLVVKKKVKASPKPKPEKQPKQKKPRPSKAPKAPDELPPDFLAFWKAYPRHLGYMRPAALEEWKRLNPDADLVKQIMDGLRDWQECWVAQKTEYQFIPIPANFLKQKRWLDGAEARRQSQRKATGRSRYQQLSPEDYRAENDRFEMPPGPNFDGTKELDTGNDLILFDP